MEQDVTATALQPSSVGTDESTLAAGRPDRVISVDIMRGFALIFMVLVHFMIYFGNEASVSSWPYLILNHLLGDWGAACFLMMMGMSQVLSMEKHKEIDRKASFEKTVIRGCYLFLVGLVMLALAWGPSQIWQWDILTLMGFATIALFFCRYMPSWAIIATGAGIAAVTPLVRNLFEFTASWGGKFIQVPVVSKYVPGILLDPAQEYKVVWSAKRIVTGFLTNGYFPIFPWLIFPLMGYVVGRRIVQGKLRKDLSWLVPLGAVLVVAGLAIAYGARTHAQVAVVNAWYSQLCFSPDSFTMVLFQTGMALVVFGGLYYCYDVIRKEGKRPTPVQSIYTRTSRFSLTFYFLHYQLIGWTLALVWIFTGKYRVGELTGWAGALLSGLAAVTLLEVLIFYWEKAEGKYSLEWILQAITRRLVKTDST